MTKHKPTRIIPDSFLIRSSKFDQNTFDYSNEEVLRLLKKTLGKPYYVNKGFVMYNGSCLDLLNIIAKSKPVVDLTITSPPYNIGKDYESKMDVYEYVDWCSSWIDLIYRVSKKHATFWLNLGYLEVPDIGLCVPIPYLLWDKSKFYLIQELVWNYGAGVQTKKRLCPRNEKWLFYVKDRYKYTFNLDEIRDKDVKYPNQKKNGILKNNPLGKNPSDVWTIPKVTTGRNRSSKERVDHPAQFPLAIVERLVKACSSQYDVILDPFSGSGTTGIAAHAFGRNYIGIEINKYYCDIAIRRFEDYLKYKSSYSLLEMLN